jgi:aryl-alcohol dehydrogenase-like predicted oxidoreductase
MQSVQPPYNLVQREIEPDLLPLCSDQQIGVIAYSPLGAGFLTGKYSRDGEVPQGTRFEVIPGHQPIYFTGDGFRIMEGLRQKADELGQSMIQLALSWVFSRPEITSVLIGARHTGHIDQALKAEQVKLTDEVIEQLDHL